MILSSTILFGLCIFVLVARWLASLRSQAKATSQGCQPLPYPDSVMNPLAGLAALLECSKAAHSGRIHAYFKGLLDSAGNEVGTQVKSVSLALPGGNRILTVDEANIHAILTHQNDKFNTGNRKKWIGAVVGQHTIVRRFSIKGHLIFRLFC